MKLFIWIALIVIFIGISVYYIILTAVARVSFTIAFKGLDLSGVSLDNIFSGQGTIRVQIMAKIVNKNTFNINLSNFHIFIYYQGTLIAQSTQETNNLNKVSIPASGTIDVVHDVTVYLNSAFLQAAKDLKAGGAKFDYDTTFRVFGFPYSYKDYFNYSL